MQLTPNQIIAELAAMGPQELHVVLEYLAEKSQQVEPRLNDAIDFQAWLRNLSYAALTRAKAKSLPRLAETVPPEQGRW